MRPIDTMGADLVLDLRLDQTRVLACTPQDGMIIEALSACNHRPDGSPLCVRFALTYPQMMQLEAQARVI